MKARFYLMAILGTAISGSALAQWDSDRERLAEQAVQVGHTVEGMVNGRPATAVPYPVSQRGCTGVGIIQPGQRAFRNGPRIDVFRACGGALELIDDMPPMLPGDRRLIETGEMAIRGAVRYGDQVARYGGYEIRAQRLSPIDQRGCALIETIVTTNDLLVSHQVGRICQ